MKLLALALVSFAFIGCASQSSQSWEDKALSLAMKGDTKAIDCMDKWRDNDMYLTRCQIKVASR
jgi:hypothetical protein